MGESIDLLILPLARTAGQEQSTVLGLFVAPPPKKSARFRKRDRLMLHLYLDGNAPLPPDQIDQILANLAKTYFNTAGTVTTALRSTAESLNQYLLDRNIRNSSIVLRDNRVSLAQSGLSHAFFLTPASVDHVHDLSLAGNGLGLSRTTHIRFTQKEMQINDSLVVSVQVPPSWTPDAFKSFQGQGPESQRRKLLSRASADLDSFLIHAQSGSGELRLLRPVRRPQPIPAPIPVAIQEDELKQEPSGIESLPSTAEPILSLQDAILESPQAAEFDESIPAKTTSPQASIEVENSVQTSAETLASETESSAVETPRPDLGQKITNCGTNHHRGGGCFCIFSTRSRSPI
jgi:hypothetical protein